MALSKKFLSSLNEIPIRNHKKLAYSLIRRSLSERKKLLYAGIDNDLPVFMVTEQHLTAELPKRLHNKAHKLFDEMRRYMLWTGLALEDSPFKQIFLTHKAIDLGESNWWERHPVWFGAILGGAISFMSALFLALIKQYWLTGC